MDAGRERVARRAFEPGHVVLRGQHVEQLQPVAEPVGRVADRVARVRERVGEVAACARGLRGGGRLRRKLRADQQAPAAQFVVVAEAPGRVARRLPCVVRLAGRARRVDCEEAQAQYVRAQRDRGVCVAQCVVVVVAGVRGVRAFGDPIHAAGQLFGRHDRGGRRPARARRRARRRGSGRDLRVDLPPARRERRVRAEFALRIGERAARVGEVPLRGLRVREQQPQRRDVGPLTDRLARVALGGRVVVTRVRVVALLRDAVCRAGQRQRQRGAGQRLRDGRRVDAEARAQHRRRREHACHHDARRGGPHQRKSGPRAHWTAVVSCMRRCCSAIASFSASALITPSLTM